MIILGYYSNVYCHYVQCINRHYFILLIVTVWKYKFLEEKHNHTSYKIFNKLILWKFEGKYWILLFKILVQFLHHIWKNLLIKLFKKIYFFKLHKKASRSPFSTPDVPSWTLAATRCLFLYIIMISYFIHSQQIYWTWEWNHLCSGIGLGYMYQRF